jgi:hypothetical protein
VIDFVENAERRRRTNAICNCPDVTEVIALPRSVTYKLEAMPTNLRYEKRSVGGKLRYVAAVLALGCRVRRADLVITGFPATDFLDTSSGTPTGMSRISWLSAD